MPDSAAQFVQDVAPSYTGGSGSDNHGLLSEWRANFPSVKILNVGWSKGKHTIRTVFAGTGSTATSQASVIVKVKNKK